MDVKTFFAFLALYFFFIGVHFAVCVTIGLPIEIISLVFLLKTIKKIKSKKPYNKLIFGISIAGTVIGFILVLPLTLFIVLILQAIVSVFLQLLYENFNSPSNF